MFNLSAAIQDAIGAFENVTGRRPTEIQIGLLQYHAMVREWSRGAGVVPEPHDGDTFSGIPLKVRQDIHGFLLVGDGDA